MNNMFWLKIASIFVLFCLPSTSITAKISEQPSIMVLLKSPSAVPAQESMKLIDATCKLFEISGVLRPITVDAEMARLPNIAEATKYSADRQANYMVYMDTAWRKKRISYHAILINPKTNRIIGEYTDKWFGNPATPEEAGLKFASNIIYRFSGKITVILNIESTPTFCDVYRDQYRLGNTEENGFRRTLFWKKGDYYIKVCKADCKDFLEKLKVDKNPTSYIKKVNLKHR